MVSCFLNSTKQHNGRLNYAEGISNDNLKSFINFNERVENIVGKGDNDGFQCVFKKPIFPSWINFCIMWSKINFLPNDKILDLSKLKVDYKVNVAKIMNYVFDGQKALWEKEEMLITSISPFSHNVFKWPFFSGV